MGWLRIAAIECNYKETDRQLKKQFICGLNNDGMIVEMIKMSSQEVKKKQRSYK